MIWPALPLDTEVELIAPEPVPPEIAAPEAEANGATAGGLKADLDANLEAEALAHNPNVASARQTLLKAKAGLRSCRNGGTPRARSGRNARHMDLGKACPFVYADAQRRPRARLSISADARVDQLGESADGVGRHRSGASVQRQARHLVLGGHHALHDRHEALQIEQLVERGGDVLRLQAVDRRRREVDAAGNDIARLLACFLKHLLQDAGHAAVLGANRLQIRAPECRRPELARRATCRS